MVFGLMIFFKLVTTQELPRMTSALMNRFQLKMLGELSFALGISFKWTADGCFMSQVAYIDTIVNKYRMEKSNPVNYPLKPGYNPDDDGSATLPESIPYRSAFGSLLSLAMSTRPDIAFAVCMLARYVQQLLTTHWTAMKRVIKYIKTEIIVSIIVDEIPVVVSSLLTLIPMPVK